MSTAVHDSANRNVFRYTGREATWSNNAKPTGDWANSVTDVYHYRSREYLPAIGQFNRLDDYRPEAMTAGFAGGLAAIHNPNLFGYVEGNPVMWGDPWGRSYDPPGGSPLPIPDLPPGDTSSGEGVWLPEWQSVVQAFVFGGIGGAANFAIGGGSAAMGGAFGLGVAGVAIVGTMLVVWTIDGAIFIIDMTFTPYVPPSRLPDWGPDPESLDEGMGPWS